MARKKLVVRQIKLNLYGPEDWVVGKIEEKGLEVASEIRQMLRDYGDKHFPEDPAYAQAAKIRAELKKKQVEAALEFEKMSPEDYVVNVLRGKVKNGRAVFRIANGSEMSLSLEDIKTQTIENNDLVRVHNQILDRTLTYPGGNKEFTDEEFERMLKGWYDEEEA